MASPATIETASGRNTGNVMVSAASAANTPLFVTWFRNVGPWPPSGPPDNFSAITMATGTRLSTMSSVCTRRRRNRCSSSALHIEALPRECHKRVLQRRPLDDQSGHPHTSLDQPPAELVSREPSHVGVHRPGRHARVEFGLLQHLS